MMTNGLMKNMIKVPNDRDEVLFLLKQLFNKFKLACLIIICFFVLCEVIGVTQGTSFITYLKESFVKKKVTGTGLDCYTQRNYCNSIWYLLLRISRII